MPSAPLQCPFPMRGGNLPKPIGSDQCRTSGRRTEQGLWSIVQAEQAPDELAETPAARRRWRRANRSERFGSGQEVVLCRDRRRCHLVVEFPLVAEGERQDVL